METPQETVIEAIDHIRGRVSPLVFWLVILLFAVSISIAFYFMMRTNQSLESLVAEKNVIINQSKQRIQERDKRIANMDGALKKQDAAIVAARDSIAKAYAIIEKQKQQKNENRKQLEKDSVAIHNLDLNGKLKYITRNSNTGSK